jgi:hypothetical protein
VFRQLLVPERITVHRVDWPLSRTEVWKAVATFLQARNDKISELTDATSLQWDSGVRAGANDAAVEVVASHWDSRRQALALHMRCVEPSFCRSFLVHVPGEEPSLARTDAPGTPRMEDVSAVRHATKSLRPQSRGRSLALAGKPANLMVEGDGFRISLPVVCLERGRLGQTIRAVDSSSHRVFWAEVVGVDRLLAIF